MEFIKVLLLEFPWFRGVKKKMIKKESSVNEFAGVLHTKPYCISEDRCGLTFWLEEDAQIVARHTC